MKQHCPCYEATPDRPAIFVGGPLDGQLFPRPAGLAELAKTELSTLAAYCPVHVSAYGIGTIVWLPTGDVPHQYIDRIRLYLSTGLRTHPRASAELMAFDHN